MICTPGQVVAVRCEPHGVKDFAGCVDRFEIDAILRNFQAHVVVRRLGNQLVRVRRRVDLVEWRTTTTSDDVRNTVLLRALVEVVMPIEHDVDAIHFEQRHQEAPTFIEWPLLGRGIGMYRCVRPR